MEDEREEKEEAAYQELLLTMMAKLNLISQEDLEKAQADKKKRR